MSDFRSLGTLTLSTNSASFAMTGLDVTAYSVIEIHTSFKTDRSNTKDQTYMTCSSYGAGESGDGGINNSGVAYSKANSNLNGSHNASVNGNSSNRILCLAAGANTPNVSDRDGFPSRLVLFHPTKFAESYERDISIYYESTNGYGSTLGGDMDVSRGIVTWPGRTEDSITSFTWTPRYGTNFLAGSWVAIYGYAV